MFSNVGKKCFKLWCVLCAVHIYIYIYWFVTFSFKKNKSSGTQVLRVFKMACQDKMTVLPNSYIITFIAVVHVTILSKSKKKILF